MIPIDHWYHEAASFSISMKPHMGCAKTSGFLALPWSRNVVAEYLPTLRCTSTVVYYCPHNPSKDPDICSLVKDIKKLAKPVCLVVVLPVFEELLVCLRQNQQLELKPTEKITTLASFTTWLERFRCGMLNEWKVVFPCMDLARIKNDDVFKYLCEQCEMEVEEQIAVPATADLAWWPLA